jgi:hypothetical protein
VGVAVQNETSVWVCGRVTECVRTRSAQNSNLSISAVASVLHLKQFLINKLQHDLHVSTPGPRPPAPPPGAPLQRRSPH